MKVLALDLGMTTGYAIGGGDEPVQSGTMRWKGKGFEGAGAPFRRFEVWLSATIHAENIGRVAFEEVHSHAATQAAHVYGGWLAVVGLVCETLDVGYDGVGVGTIKKHGAGAGNATKQDMIAAANARGWETTDDNEADALWLLDLVLTEGVPA